MNDDKVTLLKILFVTPYQENIVHFKVKKHSSWFHLHTFSQMYFWYFDKWKKTWIKIKVLDILFSSKNDYEDKTLKC